jgi:hypothetical protein
MNLMRLQLCLLRHSYAAQFSLLVHSLSIVQAAAFLLVGLMAASIANAGDWIGP